MKAYDIPAAYWPFTIEAAFPPALRRAGGGGRCLGVSPASRRPSSSTIPSLAAASFALLPKLGPDDDAYWYLMAPAPEAKEAFADWVTRPEQRTEANYAAFEEIVRGLRDLLARRSSGEKRDSSRAA